MEITFWQLYFLCCLLLFGSVIKRFGTGCVKKKGFYVFMLFSPLVCLLDVLVYWGDALLDLLKAYFDYYTKQRG